MTEPTLQEDMAAVAALIAERAPSGRRGMIGVAGPPGSGKSTLAERVVAHIAARDGAQAAALLPMDGFHLGNGTLDGLGLRAVKGAPQTFDAEGFVELVRRVRAGGADIPYPLFDRARDCTLPDAGLLRAETGLVVVEGNYLLLNDPPWRALHALFDATVMIAPPAQVLETRLIARWLAHGLSPDAARAKAQGNDMTNARTVLARSAPADLRLGAQARA